MISRECRYGLGAVRAPGVDFGQMGKRAVRVSYVSSKDNIRQEEAQGVFGEAGLNREEVPGELPHPFNPGDSTPAESGSDVGCRSCW
jgi:hypothetical protein